MDLDELKNLVNSGPTVFVWHCDGWYWNWKPSSKTADQLAPCKGVFMITLHRLDVYDCAVKVSLHGYNGSDRLLRWCFALAPWGNTRVSTTNLIIVGPPKEPGQLQLCPLSLAFFSTTLKQSSSPM
jgi:hypothetical protein